MSSAKEAREDAIFSAALEVVGERGIHKARMADIAKRAGISYGLVYHYYGSKEELFDAIVERWWSGLFGFMDEAVAEAGGAPGAEDALGVDSSRGAKEAVEVVLRKIIERFFDLYQNEPHLVGVFITEISRSTGNLSTPRLDQFKAFMNRTEAIIRGGQEAGHIRQDTSPRYLTYIFLGALETFVSAMVLGKEPIKSDAQRERIIDCIMTVFLDGARQKG